MIKILLHVVFDPSPDLSPDRSMETIAAEKISII